MSEFEQLQSMSPLMPVYLERGPEGVLEAVMPDIERSWTKTEKRIYLTEGLLPHEIMRPPDPGRGVKL